MGDIASSRESLNHTMTETNMNELIPFIGGLMTGIVLVLLFSWLLNLEEEEDAIEERIKALEEKLK